MLEVEAADAAPEAVMAIGVPVARAGAPEGTSPEPGIELLASLANATAAASTLLPDDVDGAWLRRQGFAAQSGQSLVLRSGAGAPSVVLLGLGVHGGADAERWRLAAAALVRAAGEGAGAAALIVPGDLRIEAQREVAAAVAEGAILAAYRFDRYRSEARPAGVDRLVLVAPAQALPALGDGIRRGSAAARAACFGRDLVNTPAADLTPQVLAERVSEHLGGMPGVTVDVWDERRIADEHLGGLQAVARGSVEPPRLVWATYAPQGVDVRRHVVLVGKGITFDSGGLSLKPPEGMTTMKTDMTGAAVVLSALGACAALGLPIRVTAIAPITENMPGAAAQKPGDVFTARNGLTVEVLNTDAEGRLVLADGLSLATELSPDAIVDVATLTGAQMIALGKGVGALFGSDDGLVEALRAAGARSGERLWPLPMPEDYAEHIRSDIADMKNIGRPREAGAIVAAMILSRFVGTVPWAHLDIAGPARSTETSGYVRRGATAFGVRALVEFLEHFVATVPAARA